MLADELQRYLFLLLNYDLDGLSFNEEIDGATIESKIYEITKGLTKKEFDLVKLELIEKLNQYIDDKYKKLEEDFQKNKIRIEKLPTPKDMLESEKQFYKIKLKNLEEERKSVTKLINYIENRYFVVN